MCPAEKSSDAQGGALQLDDNITISLANIPSGLVEGNHTSPGHENATRDLSTTGAKPLGTGEQQSLPDHPNIDIDAQMDLKEVEERFNKATRMGLKAPTQSFYLSRFRKMAKKVHLEQYTKRQLGGAKGKELILDYISTIPKPSVRTQLAALKRVWQNGIGLPWPILDVKMDIGKLPKVQRESTPPNSIVQEWAKALAMEKDPYLKLVWLFTAQHGWRPSHCTGMRWSDVQYDANGRPCSIISTGAGSEFKTFSPVAVNLAPNVVEALENWRKVHPNPNGNGWILPYKGLTEAGKVNIARRMDTPRFREHWNGLRLKYKLPKLRPKDMRHWVATQCRKAGLSKPATNFMQGHDADASSNMRDVYDNPPLEEWLQEQKDVLPNGPLGTLIPIEVELIAAIPPEGVSLLKDYFDGKLGIMGLMTSLEGLKMKLDVKTTTQSR